MIGKYKITPQILELVASISEKIGEVNAYFLDKTAATTRKQHKVKSVHASLKLSGISLSEAQVAALRENERIRASKKDITAATNTLKVYNQLYQFNDKSEQSLLRAHQELQHNNSSTAGQYIASNNKTLEEVTTKMNALFDYINEDDIALIKSCIVHYQITDIQPFQGGNDIIARCWQSIILAKRYPVFEHLPYEVLLLEDQARYQKALTSAQTTGEITPFIEYLLEQLNHALKHLLSFNNRNFDSSRRLAYFVSIYISEFTRKDYMNVFKDISSSTASRDLNKGMKAGILIRKGENNQTTYLIKEYEEG